MFRFRKTARQKEEAESLLDSRVPNQEQEERVQQHCKMVKLFLSGIGNLCPTYGEITQNRDYKGEIRIQDPNKEGAYHFSFRVWLAETREIIVRSSYYLKKMEKKKKKKKKLGLPSGIFQL